MSRVDYDPMMFPRPPPAFAPTVVAWARRELRDLPWRRSRDPWEILVAETMLQQTQVSRVLDRWPRFLDRFPDPRTCAAAPQADLLREWEGLGYNRRAVALHRAAIQVVTQHEGHVPSTLDELMALPGVGPYTARAVRAFAFELPAAPVDTNIGRVLARAAGATLSPKEAQALADALLSERTPAEGVWLWNQAVMELGAVVCTKRGPDCGACPARSACAWRGEGDDPAVGSAAVGRTQSRFEGSDRQLRGRMIDALRRSPVKGIDAALMLGDDADRAQRIVDGLSRDGLIEMAGEWWRLVGDEVSSGR